MRIAIAPAEGEFIVELKNVRLSDGFPGPQKTGGHLFIAFAPAGIHRHQIGFQVENVQTVEAPLPFEIPRSHKIGLLQRLRKKTPHVRIGFAGRLVALFLSYRVMAFENPVDGPRGRRGYPLLLHLPLDRESAGLSILALFQFGPGLQDRSLGGIGSLPGHLMRGRGLVLIPVRLSGLVSVEPFEKPGLGPMELPIHFTGRETRQVQPKGLLTKILLILSVHCTASCWQDLQGTVNQIFKVRARWG